MKKKVNVFVVIFFLKIPSHSSTFGTSQGYASNSIFLQYKNKSVLEYNSFPVVYYLKLKPDVFILINSERGLRLHEDPVDDDEEAHHVADGQRIEVAVLPQQRQGRHPRLMMQVGLCACVCRRTACVRWTGVAQIWKRVTKALEKVPKSCGAAAPKKATPMMESAAADSMCVRVCVRGCVHAFLSSLPPHSHPLSLSLALSLSPHARAHIYARMRTRKHAAVGGRAGFGSHRRRR